MDPDSLVTSFKTIAETGVIGAVCIVLISVVIIRERYWQKREERLTASFSQGIREERESHDKTRNAFIEEIRSNADALQLVREQLAKQNSAFEMLIKMVGKEAA